MKNIFLGLSVLSLGMITGCSEQENTNEAAYEGDEIRIQANIGAATRGDGVIEQSYAGLLNVHFIRLDKLETTYGGEIAIDGVVSTTGSSKVLTFSGQTYPAGDATVKLIGWYPNTEAFSGTASTVTFASIDGSTDIMVTEMVEGKQTLPISGITFNHALSQVRVEAYLEDATAGITWGTITSIALVNKQQDCVLTLPDPAESSVKAIVTSGGTPADLPLKNINLDNNSTITYPLTLTTSPQACGYALFIPEDAAEVLKFEIVTEKKTATAEVVSQIFEKGKSYVVTLKFGVEDLTIKPSVTIGAWTPPAAATNPDEVTLVP
jgi:hypothetical protein